MSAGIYIRTIQHNRNISKALTGRHLSEEHRKKLSEAKMGHISWNKGKKGVMIPWNKGKKTGPLTQELKEKLSSLRMGKKLSEETKRKIGDAHRGVPETKEAIVKVTKARMQNEWIKNFGVNGRLATKFKRTQPELKMFKMLKELNISFYPDYLMYDKFFVDAYLPEQNVILEVDGRYWHSGEKQQEKDRKKDLYLKACGHKVFRFWEDEFYRLHNYLRKGGEIKNGY